MMSRLLYHPVNLTFKLLALLVTLAWAWSFLLADAAAAPPRRPGGGGQPAPVTAPLTQTVASSHFDCPAAMAAGTMPSLQSPGQLSGALAGLADALVPEPTGRINLLLLGTDSRPGEPAEYGHTDAIIVVSLDPISKTAGLLSIPRDLWVTIPGYGENRINQAYRLGKIKNHPGGGPALVKETIAANLGLPVDYYILIDFHGFTQLVDLLGGVEVCVPDTLDAARYYGYTPESIDPAAYTSFVPAVISPTLATDPTAPVPGYQFLYIDAGWHSLDGQTALSYVRSRASVTADFARVQRQQAVLLAMINRAWQARMLPKLPQLWDSLAGLAQTDLSLIRVLQLARLAGQIPAEQVQVAAISHDQTIDYKAANGMRLLLPRRPQFNDLVEQLFGPVRPTAPLTGFELEVTAAEVATVN